MDEFLKFEKHGRVVTLTMSNPDKRNSLTGKYQSPEFEEACAAINGDMDVRCVILTGAGSAFSAGGNVYAMRDKTGNSAGRPAEIRMNYITGIQRIPRAFYNVQVPTIAAVNGPAIGAGCDLATMCDIRIASEKAKFAESFVKLGIVPGDGGAWFLPRVIGMARAYEMTFTGDAIDADEAYRIGLVSKVVAPDDLMEAANELAERIAANPSHALRLTKRLMRESMHTSLETLLEMSAAFQSLAHNEPEHDEAVQSLIDTLEAKKKG